MFERTAELSVGVAGLIEAIKPWLTPIKDTVWYARALWGLAFLFASLGAYLFNVNVLHEIHTAPDIVGWILTGFVCSLGSEVTHRLLEILRGFAKKAQPAEMPD